MKEMRFSLPFIGGPTIIFTKEEVKAKTDKLAVLMKDENFQHAVFSALGKTVGVAVALVGINLVWKWYLAYVALAKLGVVITTAAWLKWGAVAAIAGSGATFTGMEIKSYRQWKAERVAVVQLSTSKSNKEK